MSGVARLCSRHATFRERQTKFEVVKGEITELKEDEIVIPANEISRAGDGPLLLVARPALSGNASTLLGGERVNQR